MKTAFFSHDDCKLHEMGAWHPEAPSRLQAIEDAVRQSVVAAALDWRSGPLATEADLARVHTADAIYRIRENCPSRQSSMRIFRWMRTPV
jgi:acetoin utilization deacetylase AcuC-like enzyme